MPSGHVLVVEDDDTIRRLLIEYLKQHALLTVDGARDAIEALHFVARQPYSVIILDLMMPKMSGGDFLDSLTAMMKDPSIQTLGNPPAIIVVTAAPAGDIPSDTITQRSPLVKAVLRKPVDIEELAELIESL
ncbi:MAG TPA: response regulator [Thermoanaerobaculia bacterium]|jgi:CheY-like chemotaxis protein|nr:response regulator [Thermoanaerobaculia bacterium]